MKSFYYDSGNGKKVYYETSNPDQTTKGYYSDKSEGENTSEEFSSSKLLLSVFFCVLAIICFFISRSLFINVKPNEMVVIQSITGKLNIYSTPGLKMRDFGNVTVYEKNNQYSFSGKEDSLQEDNSSIGIRFNDGGTAKLSGSALWILPSDPKSIRIIHNFYGSQKEVERRLIRASLEKAAGFTGLLMSTKESLTTRRSEMIDSIFNKSSKGLVISDGVRIYNLVINNVEYDSTVLSSLIRSEIAKLSADGDIYKKGIISNPSETLAKRLEVYETLNKKMEKALKK